jgi:hypothetical protein
MGFEALSSGKVEAAKAALADATWWIPGSLPVSSTHHGKKAIFEGFLGKAQALFQSNSMATQVRNAIGKAIAWRGEAAGVLRALAGPPPLGPPPPTLAAIRCYLSRRPARLSDMRTSDDRGSCFALPRDPQRL